MADKIQTPPFRVSFPDVFQARSYEGGEARFSITMLFPEGTDLTALKKAVKEVIVEKYPDPEKRPKNLRLPFRDGGEKDHLDGYEEGVTFVRAVSTAQPEVLDRNGQEVTSARDFYAGCYADAFIAPFFYDKKGNKGVSFGLRSVRKLADGVAFGAGGSCKDDYGDAPDLPEGAMASGSSDDLDDLGL